MTQPINPGSSQPLTGAQVEMLMRQAGFPDSELKTGVGVAFAESTNDPTAHNTKDRDNSYGLFQINMKGELEADRLRKFKKIGVTKKEDLFDPATNVKAAYIIWKESGWKAWTTYTSGKYNDGIIPRTGEAIEGAKDAVSSPITGLTKSIDNAGKTAMKSLASGLGIVVGLTAIVLGIVIVMGQSKKAQQLAGTVAKATVGKGKLK